MIDVHTHILPSIDDGSKDVNETLKMIDEAYKAGFTDIITTSHYIDGYFDINKDQREMLIDGLKEIVNKDIHLHNGAEAYITPNLVELYNEEIIPTLANSRYVLFELPMTSNVLYVDRIIAKLIANDYIPIIAHPERYTFIQKDIDKAYNLIDKGALLQCNYGSFIGRYGAQAQKAAVKLLKNDKITFLGTDAHRSGSLYNEVERVLEKIEKTVGADKVDEITVDNPKKILNDEKIY